MDYLKHLLEHEGLFIARTHCGPGWDDELITASIYADRVIFICYLAVPLVCFWLYRNLVRGALTKADVFITMLLGCAFIVSCGFTHEVNARMFSTPFYRLDVYSRCVCAAISALAVAWGFGLCFTKWHKRTRLKRNPSGQ